MSKTYKQRHPFEQRKKIALKYMETDPDKAVTIVEKHPKSKLPNIANNKFLIKRVSKFGAIKLQIEHRLRERCKDGSAGKESFSVYVGGSLVGNEDTIEHIWSKFKEPDGIVYMHYREQQAFGE